MSRRTITVAALALAFTLTGCTIDAGESLDPIIGPGAAEVAPAPTVEAPPVAGDTLTADQARVMNRDLTDTLTAYKLADGTWVAVDATVDLPETVKADAVARIKAAPWMDAGGTPSLLGAQIGTITTSTGRTIIAVANYDMWCDAGATFTQDRWSALTNSKLIATCVSKDEAIAAANQAAAEAGTITVLIID